MKRKWSLRLGAAVLCAVLLGSCGSTAAAPAESTAPADPLTGQQLLYPEQRAAAVVIENTTDSTTQWGIGSASVVLEALTESGSSTELCLVYPALEAMPIVGPVTRGQDLYWRLLSGQQVLPIQCGSSAYAKRYLEYYNLRAVDAQEVGRNAFVSTGYSWDSTPLWRTSGKAVYTLHCINIGMKIFDLNAILAQEICQILCHTFCKCRNQNLMSLFRLFQYL